MNNLIKNIENKIKEIEQDILLVIDIQKNEDKYSVSFIRSSRTIKCLHDQNNDLCNDLLQIKQLKKSLNEDRTIESVLDSVELFKDNLSI